MVIMSLLLTSWSNFESFGKAKEIQTGMIAVLQGTEPVPAPTLHCIVPGGGVDKIAIGRI
jgi:hypothetical protein